MNFSKANEQVTLPKPKISVKAPPQRDYAECGASYGGSVKSSSKQSVPLKVMLPSTLKTSQYSKDSVKVNISQTPTKNELQ